MANNLISASVGFSALTRLRIPRATPNSAVILNGNAYRLYTWAGLEKEARTPGVQVTYHGTEVRLEDDFSERMYRIFTVSKVGSYAAYQVAIEA